MKYVRTQNNYYYKINNSGKKTRISELEYSKNKSNRKHNQKGGARVISIEVNGETFQLHEIIVSESKLIEEMFGLENNGTDQIINIDSLGMTKIDAETTLSLITEYLIRRNKIENKNKMGLKMGNNGHYQNSVKTLNLYQKIAERDIENQVLTSTKELTNMMVLSNFLNIEVFYKLIKEAFEAYIDPDSEFKNHPTPYNIAQYRMLEILYDSNCDELVTYHVTGHNGEKHFKIMESFSNTIYYICQHNDRVHELVKLIFIKYPSNTREERAERKKLVDYLINSVNPS